MFGALFGPMRKHFRGYAAPTVIAPQWEVAYLVFQSGLPKTRGNSLTGGGQIYGHEYAGTFQPVTRAYSPGVQSSVGGGQILALPAYLAPLYGGQRGVGGI